MTGRREYGTAHARVRRTNGPASTYPCADQCGRVAEDWSQVHEQPLEDPQSYRPLCKKCHAIYDLHLKPRGERQGAARLTSEQVLEIRDSYSLGNLTHQQLATKFRVNKSTIGRIVRGAHWTHIIGPTTAAKLNGSGENNGRAKLSWDTVAEIRAKFKAGETNLSQLSREYGVSRPAITNVIAENTWKL